MSEYFYNVTVGFANIPDVEEEFEINAPKDADEYTILEIIQENIEILNILSVSEVNKLDSNTWDIVIDFCGLCSNIYTVEADNESDAIEEAMDSAAYDLDILDFELVDEISDTEYEEADQDYYSSHSEDWYIARDRGDDTDPFI